MPWPEFMTDRQTGRQGGNVFLVYNPAVEMKHVAARESVLNWQLPDVFKNRTCCAKHKNYFKVKSS
jgi:elongation factor P--beta-lysine ligase